MAAGTVYTEIDLDSRKFDAAQKRILYDAKTMAINVEDSWKVLSQKSDVMYNAMRQQANNAYARITSDSKSSANERVRAEEAMHAKIKALNEQQFGHHTTLIEGLKKNWMAASAAIIATFYAMQKVFQVTTLGANVKSIEDSFTLLSKNAGIAGDQLIKKLEEVTNATVDSSDLMRKANRLIVEGFSAKQIIQIGEAARVAARLMGTDVKAAYEQVADAIVNLRQRGLKTAGFVIDLDEAYQKHADRLGIVVKYLNDYGKQMALVAAVEEKRIEILKKMGPLEETESERIQKLSAGWQELKENIGKATLKLIDFFFIEGRSKTLPEIFGFRWETYKTTPKPEKPGVMTERYPDELELAKNQEATAKKAEDQLKLNLEYGKKILSIGYLTYQDKLSQLEAERKIAIEQAKGLDVSKINESFNKQIVELKKLELDRLSAIKVAFGKIITEAENLSDIGKMPDWRESLDFIEKGWIRVNGELRQSGAYIPVDQIGRLDVAMQGLLYSVEKLSDLGEMPDWRESLEQVIPKGYAIIEGHLIRINDLVSKQYRTELLSLQGLETRIAKERELRDAKVSLGWMRPAEAGLAGIEDEKKLLAERLGLDEKRLQNLRDMGAPLADIYSQEDKITQLKRQQVVLDASRLRYISETAPAYDGLLSGFKKYVTESGTLYTQLEGMAYNTAKGMEGNVSGFLQSTFDKTKSWKDKMAGLFKGLADSFIKALSDMAAKALVTNLFGGSTFQGAGSAPGWAGWLTRIVGLFGGGGSALSVSGGAGGISGSGTGGGASFETGFDVGYSAHTGKGPYEIPSLYRIVPSETFYNARRFHQGIGEDEIAAIIRKDESVLTPGQMKALSQSRPNQSISVGPFNINMEKGQVLNPALLKGDLEREVTPIVIKIVRSHM